jgi:pimeloyl-ACP methyl ester carboxylesterase
MRSQKTVRAVAGTLLCAAGAWLALPKTYTERTYLIPAGGCRLETTIFEKKDGGAQGTVIFFPGIAANKKIMAFLAQGFAEQGLRVYVPDLPGHGHSPGPFSPGRAEECGATLLSGLIARGMANPHRTILAGHSMGGAIALRVAARIPVAGVVAISPAPMRSAYGVQPEMLLFQDPGPLPERFVVLSGSLEPESMRGNAADLVSAAKRAGASYIVIRGATHVSLLFSRGVVRSFQEWTGQTLHLRGAWGMPSLRPLYGGLMGFFGLLLLANPFLREATERKQKTEETEMRNSVPWARLLVEFTAGAILAVFLLRLWNPLRVIHLFEGDYLASFLLILGIALVLLHWKSVREQFSRTRTALLRAAFAALILFLLFSAWMELSLYAAWLTPAKWLRFPFLLAALLPYHFAEEICLGPAAGKSGGLRLAAGLLLRLLAWGALALGVFFLHSGEILMVLLGPYFAVLFLLQRRGMDIVRQETDSAGAAALFGAILLTGFCLVIFPVT